MLYRGRCWRSAVAMRARPEQGWNALARKRRWCRGRSSLAEVRRAGWDGSGRHVQVHTTELREPLGQRPEQVGSRAFFFGGGRGEDQADLGLHGTAVPGGPE